jgi:glycosyltransferase involved in cell wall biosynthesis
MNPTISVCVISGAEAHRLDTCLASVDGLANETIVIVDDRANDGTAEVARRRGAKVFIEKWKGHIGQKNSAADKASGDWILSLDADEAVSSRLREEISRAIREGRGSFSAYSFPRCSRYLGRWIRHGDWYPDEQTRIWRRGAARWGGTDPHDKLIVNGKVGKLHGDLLHYSMTGFDHQISKTIAYADEFVRQSEVQARKISMTDLWFRPAYRFLRCYFLRCGFLDGWQGYSIAWMTAFYTFLRYAKAKEAQEQSRMSERATDRGHSL